MTLRETHVTDLPGWKDPLEILDRSRGLERPALLLSADTAAGRGRWSLFAARPFMTLRWKEGRGVSASGGLAREAAGRDPFDWVAECLRPYRCASPRGWIFPGGAVGIFSYDAGRETERLPSRAADDRYHPWIDLAVYAWAINWDHLRRRWAVLSFGSPEGAGEGRVLCRQVAEWALGREGAPPMASWDGAPVLPPPVAAEEAPGGRLATVPEPSLGREAYLQAVRAVKERIAAGDCYEVNLSRRLTIPVSPDLRSLFGVLSGMNPAPFAAYIESSSGCLVGSSPERFLSVRGRRAESRPIKGTAPRSPDAERDRRAAARLLESDKDRAENVMIVDLVRNDLGRVCSPGTVTVPALCRLESYAGVHHLVSSVTGELAPGEGAMDAVRALFPPGSMTGAPKIRAMEIIDELEPVRRGPYAGAAGYIGADGSLDLCVVIRSFVATPGRLDLQVGGAVVADSDPEEEYGETLVKGERALGALEAVGWAGVGADR